jgi:hypothetical protein
MARRVPVTKGRDNLGRDTLSYELRKGWRVTFAVSRAQTGFIVERLVLEPAGDCPPGGITAALIGADPGQPPRLSASDDAGQTSPVTPFSG